MKKITRRLLWHYHSDGFREPSGLHKIIHLVCGRYFYPFEKISAHTSTFTPNSH